jgi:hypothetical protein
MSSGESAAVVMLAANARKLAASASDDLGKIRGCIVADGFMER